MKLQKYIEDVSSSSGTPGGGNVLGTVEALSCGLMLMSLRIAVLKKGDSAPEFHDLEASLIEFQESAVLFAHEDSKRFSRLMSCWKEGGSKLESAVKSCADISVDIAELALNIMELIDRQNMEKYKNIITDVGIAFELAVSCFRGAEMNYRINSVNLPGSKRAGIDSRMTDLKNRFNCLEKSVRGKINGIIDNR